MPGEKAAAEADLAALHAIDRASLDTTDQLAYDVFEYSTKDTLKGYQPEMLDVTKVRPINHFFGLPHFLSDAFRAARAARRSRPSPTMTMR